MSDYVFHKLPTLQSDQKSDSVNTSIKQHTKIIVTFFSPVTSQGFKHTWEPFTTWYHVTNYTCMSVFIVNSETFAMYVVHRYHSMPYKRSCFSLLVWRTGWWLIVYTRDVTTADYNAPRKLQMLSMVLKCTITNAALLMRMLPSYELCHNIWKTSAPWVHSPCKMVMAEI